jgi:hypothetical protein
MIHKAQNIILLSLCALFVVQCQTVEAVGPNCSLRNGMKKKVCARKISNGCDLEFVGPGCRQFTGTTGDGGCQEAGYCGFTCRQRCRGFNRCEWIQGQGCRRKVQPKIIMYAALNQAGTEIGTFDGSQANI